MSSHNPYLADKEVQIGSRKIYIETEKENIKDDDVEITAIRDESRSVKTVTLKLQKKL